MEDQRSIRRKSEQVIEQAFLHTGKYRVNKTGIIKIQSVEVEVGSHFIGKRLTVKYSHDLSHFYVYEAGELNEVKVVDKLSNGQMKRKQIRLTEEIQND